MGWKHTVPRRAIKGAGCRRVWRVAQALSLAVLVGFDFRYVSCTRAVRITKADTGRTVTGGRAGMAGTCGCAVSWQGALVQPLGVECSVESRGGEDGIWWGFCARDERMRPSRSGHRRTQWVSRV